MNYAAREHFLEEIPLCTLKFSTLFNMNRYLLFVLFFILNIQGAFAQVRDLFAEFESETAKEDSVAENEVLQSSVAQLSSSSLISSSAAISSSSIASSSSVLESSSAQISSSSEVSSSSQELSSSSLSSAALSSSSSVETLSSASVDSLQAVSSSAVLDSLALSSSSIALDSLAPSDSLSQTEEASQPVEAPLDTLPKDTLPQDSLKNDSLSGAALAQENKNNLQISSSSVASIIPSSSSMSRRDLLGPVKVSKVYGMDDVKGRYKSPRKAMFMSLVIPGSGQLYTGGSAFTYVRGGVYLALEAALWTGWGYYSIHKYNKQVDRYKSFAKKHYSIGRYEIEMRSLFDQLADETEESRFEDRYMSSRKSFCEALYGTASSYGCYTDGKLFERDGNHRDRFDGKNDLGDELKAMKNVYDLSAVYQQVSDRSYVLGWDDIEDRTLPINLGLEDPNSATIPLGKSKHMDEYRSMREKANDYADMQVWFFGGIILNHLVSAVDAVFTANAHNKQLYSEDLAWYDKLHFNSYINVFDGLDIGVQASWGF